MALFPAIAIMAMAAGTVITSMPSRWSRQDPLCLELAVEHAVPAFDHLFVLARVNRNLRLLTRPALQTLLHQRLHRDLFRFHPDPVVLVGRLEWIVQHLEWRPGVLAPALTAEHTAFLLLRLATLSVPYPDVVESALRLLAAARPDGLVAELAHGSFLLYRQMIANLPHADLNSFDVMHARCLDIVGTGKSLTTANVPDHIIKAIEDMVTSLPDHNDRFHGRIPHPFSLIPSELALDVASGLAEQFRDELRVRPDLVQILFGLGMPLALEELPWEDYKAADLRAVLPFVCDGWLFIKDHSDAICKRTDLIGALLCSWDLTMLGKTPDCVPVMIQHLIRAGQYDWRNASNGCTLLHLAVDINCPDSVAAVMDKFPFLAQVRDLSGRTPKECIMEVTDDKIRLLLP